MAGVGDVSLNDWGWSGSASKHVTILEKIMLLIAYVGLWTHPPLFVPYRLARCCVAMAVLFCYSVYAFASADIDRDIDINIPENTRLEDALIEWGLISGVTVMVDTTVVDGHLTKGVGGHLSARKALTLILMGSGLQYRQDGARIMVIPAGTMVRSGLRLE